MASLSLPSVLTSLACSVSSFDRCSRDEYSAFSGTIKICLSEKKKEKLLKDKIVYTIWVPFAFQVVIVHFIVHGPVSQDFRNLIIVPSAMCYINQFVGSFQKDFNFLEY